MDVETSQGVHKAKSVIITSTTAMSGNVYGETMTGLFWSKTVGKKMDGMLGRGRRLSIRNDIKLDPYITSYTKINSRWTEGLTTKKN